ncbi:Maleate isomerase [subsurface metagenome]
MEEDRTKLNLKGWRAEVGMLAPVAGMYREFEEVAPEGIRFSRGILGLKEVTPEALKKMAEDMVTESIKLNIGHKMDLIALGCTSGSFIGGPGYDQGLIKKIEDACGVQTTTTSTALLEAFKDLGIKKMAMCGPYEKGIFDAAIDFFNGAGIETLHLEYLGYHTSEDYWEYRHNPYPVYKLVRDCHKAAPDADCVFISCMWSRILGMVDTVEAEIGKPVISACSAVMYQILKILGIPDPVYHYGQLLQRPRLAQSTKEPAVA